MFSAPPVIITPSLAQDDGWIIIQRRVDASESFYRPWDDYVSGFGDIGCNFWLGLDAIHHLTTAQPMRLQIDVEPWHIPPVSINYQQIHVGDGASDYLLTITSDHDDIQNTLNTSMNYHSGGRFTTYDRDNDQRDSHNCAEEFTGAWWYTNCYMLNLNGVYGSSLRMHYLSDNFGEPIRTVTMKIKPI